MRILLASLVLLPIAACSSNNSSIDAKPASTFDAPATIDAPVATFDAPPGSPDAPKSGFTLHFVNQLNWCDITVDGVKTVGSAPADKVYPSGTVVNLFGAPTPSAENFHWGFWEGTDGQLDGGSTDTDQTATVTMTADKTITVCCPLPNQTTCE